MRRVVITGIGLVTPVGIGLEATWQALLAGQSGAGPITHFDASAFATKFACEVKGWEAAAPTWFDKRELKHVDRFLQFGVAASMMALADAGYTDLKVPAGEEDRWGCYIGAGLGGVKTIEDTHDTGRSKGPRHGFSPYMSAEFNDTDEAVARQAQPYVIKALDALIADIRAKAAAETSNELRPMVPGEQRINNLPLYLETPSETSLGSTPPSVMWGVLIGAMAGSIAAIGLMLFQQRKPRVNNDDDFPSAIGLWVWTHVGRAGRRYAATADQLRGSAAGRTPRAG